MKRRLSKSSIWDVVDNIKIEHFDAINAMKIKRIDETRALKARLTEMTAKEVECSKIIEKMQTKHLDEMKAKQQTIETMEAKLERMLTNEADYNKTIDKVKTEHMAIQKNMYASFCRKVFKERVSALNENMSEKYKKMMAVDEARALIHEERCIDSQPPSETEKLIRDIMAKHEEVLNVKGEAMCCMNDAMKAKHVSELQEKDASLNEHCECIEAMMANHTQEMKVKDAECDHIIGEMKIKCTEEMRAQEAGCHKVIEKIQIKHTAEMSEAADKAFPVGFSEGDSPNFLALAIRSAFPKAIQKAFTRSFFAQLHVARALLETRTMI